MKKALLSLLLVAAIMPFAMSQSTLQVVTNDVSACGTYTWNVNGQTYTSSNVVTYMDDANNTLYVLNLTINHLYSLNENVVSENCSYQWRGIARYQSGTYYDTVFADTNLGTCDSFFVAHIVIPTAEINTIHQNACGSYDWNGNTYNASGNYADTTELVNPDSSICYHIDVLALNIVNSLSVSETVSHCGNYNWYDSTYTQTGAYIHVETNADSTCDTIHTLNLTIVVDTANVQEETACGYYVWSVTHDTLTTGGLHSVNDTNTTTGCVTYRSLDLNLIEMRKPVNDTFMVGCNGVNFTISSLAGSTTKRFTVDTLFDTNLVDRRLTRCYDSTIHLHVTIHMSGRDTTYVNACDSFRWEMNSRTYYNTPTTYPSYAFATDTFGCDSIMHLALIIKKAPVISAINGEWHLHAGDTAKLYPTCTEGATYKWTYGNQTSTADTLIIPNVPGNANMDVSLVATLRYPAENFSCYDTSWITIVTFVGIDDVQGTQVSLYPNPTVGQLNIESAETIREVTIYNALGQQVLNNYISANKSQMNLSSLSKGNYTMRVILQNGETIVRKFVITK